MKSPTFFYLTDVYFEPGAVAVLPELLDRFSVRRALLVTDKGVRAAGLADRVPFKPAAIFDDISTNPTESAVLAGLTIYQENGCDGIVAVGGGSPIDCAKAIAVLATHPPPLEQYAFLNGGATRITANKLPLFAIPTTAGTGSEVGRGSLITFKNGRKLGLLSPKLIPQSAICDPLLTLSMPPGLTAATGMDAVSHCVESFCSPKFNPVAEAIAIDGLRRSVAHIRRATETGSDLSARSEMLIAATEGGMTFQKGLGAVHSLSHALGALAHHKLHHGMLNALLLPHVLRYNAPACADKLARLAEVLGLRHGEDVPDYFEKLRDDLRLPKRLGELGVKESELQPVAHEAEADHCTPTNPREMKAADALALLRSAM